MMTTLVLLLCAQDKPTAEELYNKVQDKQIKAKSLSFKAQVKAKPRDTNPVGGEWTVEAAYKEGNKAAILVNGTNSKDFKILCDGSKTWHGEPGHAHSHEAPKTYSDDMRAIAARAGVMVMLGSVEDPEAAKSMKASGFKFGAEEKIGDRNAQLIEYTLTLSAGGRDIKINQQLYVDAESQLPLKRRVTDEHGTDITENYSDAKLDAEIPEDTFKVKE
jgi:outer membrane lipoprotein-sorting protein